MQACRELKSDKPCADIPAARQAECKAAIAQLQAAQKQSKKYVGRESYATRISAMCDSSGDAKGCRALARAVKDSDPKPCSGLGGQLEAACMAWASGDPAKCKSGEAAGSKLKILEDCSGTTTELSKFDKEGMAAVPTPKDAESQMMLELMKEHLDCDALEEIAKGSCVETVRAALAPATPTPMTIRTPIKGTPIVGATPISGTPPQGPGVNPPPARSPAAAPTPAR